MINKKEQIQQLQDVRALVADEENAYSIAGINWCINLETPPDSFEGDCGTPACVKGWAMSLKYYELFDTIDIENSIFTYDEIVDITEPVVKVPGSHTMKWYIDPEWFTRKRTVAMLDNLLKGLRERDTVEIDWLAMEKQDHEQIIRKPRYCRCCKRDGNINICLYDFIVCGYPGSNQHV